VENDETLFYLILPADWKKQDSEAEVFSSRSLGKRVSSQSMRDLKQNSLESVKEGEEAFGGASFNSNGGRGNRYSNGSDDNISISSSSTKGKRITFGKSPFKKGSSENNECIYQFRVLLDGNEKFIWLQAAAELGRLCSNTAVSLTSATVDVTK